MKRLYPHTSVPYTVLLMLMVMLFACSRFDNEVVPDKEAVFRKFYGGFDQQLAATVLSNESGFMLFGSSTSFSELNDGNLDPESRLYMVQVDRAGNEIWSVVLDYDTTMRDMEAVEMKIGADGNYRLLANIKEEQAESSDTDIVLFTTTPEGIAVDTSLIEAAGSQTARDFTFRPGGGLVIVGNDAAQEENGILIIATNETLDEITTIHHGLTIQDMAQSIERIGSDFFILSTIELQQDTPNGSRAGDKKLYVLSFGDDGGRNFDLVIEGQDGNQVAADMIVTSDNQLMLLGTDEMSKSPFVSAVDPLLGTVVPGVLIRANELGAGSSITATDVIEASNGDLNILGTINGSDIGFGQMDIYFDRIGPTGEVVWDAPRIYGGPRDDLAGGVLQTDDLGFAILSSNNLEGRNALLSLLKTNNNGELIE